MSLKLDFGEGTDADTWVTVFTPLTGWLLKIKAYVGPGTPFVGDVRLVDINENTETGRYAFWFERWNGSTNEYDGEVFPVDLDQLFELTIY